MIAIILIIVLISYLCTLSVKTLVTLPVNGVSVIKEKLINGVRPQQTETRSFYGALYFQSRLAIKETAGMVSFPSLRDLPDMVDSGCLQLSG